MLLSLLARSGAPVVQWLPVPWYCMASPYASAACLVPQYAGVAAGCREIQSSCTSSIDADASDDAQPSTSGSEEAAAATAATTARRRGPVHAPHLPLDDTEFDIVLRYNTDFVTDPDRSYAIGHTRAFERVTRQELRKALAAQRLFLKDEAAAYAAGPAGSKQPLMRDQMLRRLTEMQDALAGR